MSTAAQAPISSGGSSHPDISLGDINAALSASTAAEDKTLVIRQVAPGIVTFSIPFTRAGALPIGNRSTAIRLNSSDVFLYVSSPATPATKEILSRLSGQGGNGVKYLVIPDGEHGIHSQDYVDAFPNAQPIGVARMKEKRPNIKWAGLFGAGGEKQTYGFESEISLHQVAAHMNDELVAIHQPSGTLLTADMIFNLPATESYSRAGGFPLIGKLLGGGSLMAPGTFAHEKAMAAVVKDKTKLKEELRPIHAAKWDRLIPTHGEVIETGGRNAWDKVWARYAQDP